VAGVAGAALGAAVASTRRRRPEGARRAVTTDDSAYAATVEALARAIEARTQWAGADLRRIQRHAQAVAEAAGLSASEVEAVRIAALLHDVGCLAVPPHILAKPGPLSAEEFDRIRAHPEVGAALLSGVAFSAPVTPIILAHHERWDGRGYPRGLTGADIPAGARILAIADAYDSLRHERPYRDAFTHDEAVAVLRRESGRALDPALVEVYLAALPALERTDAALEAAEGTSPGDPLKGIAHAQRESAVLHELSQAMTESAGLGNTADALGARLRELLPHEAFAVFLVGDDGLLRVAHVVGLSPDALRIIPLDDDQAAPARVARSGRGVVNGDPLRDLVSSPRAPVPTLRASVVAPLVAGGRVIGALALYSCTTDAYSAGDGRLLDRIAAQAATALANADRFDRVRAESLTDALTGLPNTRFLMMHIAQELARASRQGSELSLLVVDLDDFKRVNDTAGHHIGDRLLREVAHTLRAGVRSYDVCARYGGDEFLVMLAECGVEEIEGRCRELEAALSKLSVEAGDRRIRARVSLGASVFPSDGETFETLLAAADKRMYSNKDREKRRRRPNATAQPVSTPAPTTPH
jgi:diguanylate cyclase (GGDEF)-like protein